MGTRTVVVIDRHGRNHEIELTSRDITAEEHAVLQALFPNVRAGVERLLSAECLFGAIVE